jgi:membrane protein YdbS with pleckstrin-like domain
MLAPPPNVTEVVMSVSLIALIVVILLLIGALPSWGYSSGWGYWPSGGLGIVLLILIILMVMGRI